jgi:hypothetical protein
MSVSDVMDKNPNYKTSKSKSKSNKSKLQSLTLMFVNAFIAISNTQKQTKLMTRSVSIMIVCTLVLLLPIMTLDPVAFAEKKITRGPVECIENNIGNDVTCCQDETGEDNIEIRYCTICHNNNPPSDCEERHQVENFNPHTGTHSSGDKTLQQPDSSNDNKNDIRTNIPNNKEGSLAK